MPHPDPAGADTRLNEYVFERRVDYPDQADRERGFIDLYRRGCFVLEAKQGSDVPIETEAESLGVHEPDRRYGTARRDRRAWERAMKKAKNQAYRHARGLPDEEGWPPFIVAVDVGYCIDLYADFARQGKNYVPFPEPVLAQEPVQRPVLRQEADLLALPEPRGPLSGTRPHAPDGQVHAAARPLGLPLALPAIPAAGDRRLREGRRNAIEGEGRSAERPPAAEDCRAYDTILQEVAEQQIEIGLSDGAENNYPKFGDALADL